MDYGYGASEFDGGSGGGGNGAGGGNGGGTGPAPPPQPSSQPTPPAPPVAAGGGGGAGPFGGYSEYMGGGDSDDFHPRTLYVGNLDPSISEEFIMSLFGQIGAVTKSKIIHETGNDPYAFIEFAEHSSAVNAITAMNKRNLLGREMKVNWATSPGAQQKVDTSKHHHVFVGDLSPEIDNKSLRDAFAPFGEISEAKVIRDLQTLKSKGYGFVSFVKKEDAERAIEGMNGQWLGRRTIRTNWATRKPTGKQLTFDEVYQQTGPSNCTVYVGGVTANTSDEDLRKFFAKFGAVVEVRVFKQQGYAFIRFDNKETATQAIVNAHGAEINGTAVRCSWGKEGGTSSAGAGQRPGLYGYGYGYGSSGNPAAAAAAQSQSTPGGQNYWNYYNYYANPQQGAYQQQWSNYWPSQGSNYGYGGQ